MGSAPLETRKDGYPKSWPEITARIMERDGNCCQKCGLPNHLVGYRNSAGTFFEAALKPVDLVPELWLAWPPNEPLNFRQLRLWVALLKSEAPISGKWFVVKLGVAHLDRLLIDHSDSNLAALCAQCHLRHDLPVSVPRAVASRRYGSKRLESHYPLFADQPLPHPPRRKKASKPATSPFLKKLQ